MERIGFVGAGLMGHGAAKHLLKAGHPLSVIANRNRQPIEDLVQRGAAEVKTLRGLAEASDTVFLCLPDAKRVEQVLNDEDGVLAGARAGQLIIDMTTSFPDQTKRLNVELAARGISFIDGPMNRTPKEAELGLLNVMLGGSDEEAGRARPLVETFSENVWHVGPAGAAHAIKLLNNFLSISSIAAVLEAAVAADRFGISHDMLLEICSQGGANSAMLGRFLAYPIDGDASQFQATASTLLKDVSYFNQVAGAAGLDSTLSKAVQSFFQRASDMGHAGTMAPELYDVLKMAGASTEPK